MTYYGYHRENPDFFESIGVAKKYGTYIGYSEKYSMEVVFEIVQKYAEETNETYAGSYDTSAVRGISKVLPNDLMFNIEDIFPITNCRKLNKEDTKKEFIDLYKYRIDMNGKAYPELVNKNLKILEMFVNPKSDKILLAD
jgi:hypothetical protein